ncbi:MAG: hypothetical protein ACJAZ6_001801 [Oleispira sp.]|jgi:hypothetical protein
MKASRIIILLVIGLAIYMGYKAIYSLPNEYVKQANDFQRSYKQQMLGLSRFESDFKILPLNNQWEFLQPYATREKWAETLASARTEFNAAEKISNDVIQPIVDRNHEDDISKLVKALSAANKLIDKSAELSIYPSTRVRLILDARKNKASYFEEAQKLLPKAEKLASNFYKAAKKSKDTHANKAEDIEGKIAQAQNLLSTLIDQKSILIKEHASADTDFALYGDTYKALMAQYQRLNQYINENNKLLQQLDRSYVKILSDQRIDYYVIVGRATWCEGDYCNDGNSYRFPKSKVDQNTFEYFESLTVSTIADKGWGSLSVNIPQARWDALNISPRLRWPSNHDYAEFWVDNTVAHTFHKYTIIDNETVTEQDWKNVSNDLFWKNQADLGMAIASKPLGFYESEVMTSAEPVGMSMIAKPTTVDGVSTGSNQYGEWRQSNGNSFWHYYGMYSMFNAFMPSNRYSHNQWNGYNSAGRSAPYYGHNNEYGTYGSSTYSNSKYKNSSYSRRNPNVVKGVRSGNISRVSNSVRGAGPSGRGKGPSGGGK